MFAAWYHPGQNTLLCDKLVWYPLFVYIICTLLVQVTLTLRIYAVTMKNIPIVTGFVIVTVSQLVLGITWIALAVRDGVPDTGPPIPLDSYLACIFSRHRYVEIAHTSISLAYEILTFSLMIFLAKSSKARGLKVPRILGTIVQDATWYFLVMFFSHVALIMTLTFGREAVQLLPASGTAVYLPVMISRMVLSLRKAADLQQGGPGESTANVITLSTIQFVRLRRSTTGG